jgi:long-chain fatty acid transport protein
MTSSTPIRRAQARLRVALLGLTLCALSAAPTKAAAGGLLLYEVGSSDVGLATAGYGARAQDASTVLTNPAGMTRLAGSHVLVGGQVLYADLAFDPDSGTSPALGTGSGGNPVGWFPGGGAYVTYAITHDVTVGLAAAGTFGLALGYDEGWVGRYYAQEATMAGVSVLPSVAWRVNDRLSVGASLNAMYGVLVQKVGINSVTGPDGQLALDDRAWGFGANVGVLWEPAPGTRLGLVYNSQVNLDFSARPEFTGLSPALQALLAARGLDTAKVQLGIKVPQGIMASAFHQVDGRWAVLASAGWQQWSRFGMLEAGISDTSDPTSVTTDLGFDDTWHLALGAQLRATPAWRIDAGVAYDSSFQDSSNVSPMLPADAAWRFGLGVRNEATERFAWGVAAEYAYGGTLGVNRQSTAPVALGGRGDLSGAYGNTGILFLAVNVDWKL